LADPMKTPWSQNFLANRSVAERCVRALELDGKEPVLEIGPGRGVLTEILLDSSPALFAVEIDPRMVEFLREKFAGERRLTLLCSDFLDVPAADLPPGPGLKVIGNLPYAVVSPILQKLLAWPAWSAAVVMVQKEVGRRILSGPGSREYGILAISVRSRAKAEKVCDVNRGSFRPAPNVDSMVLRLTPLPRPVYEPEMEEKFFAAVRGSFAHRRKTIQNSLARHLEIPPERIRKAFTAAGLDPEARAETFSVEAFKRISEIL